METGDGEAYAQAGASETGAPSAGAGGGEHVVRDRDPPPIYDGESPESTFRQFEKAVRLWEFESDIPAKKRGAKLVRALVGAAKLATEDLEFEAITAEDGVKNVMSRLREFFQPHLEVSLPRAFEAAVYGPQKQPKESFIEYIARAERNFQNLKKEGVELPAGAQGYIMYRQAGLTEAQDQKILTWSEGKYDRALIISGLRRLDKVIKEKGKANYFEQTENVAAETFHQEANELEETDEEYMCTSLMGTWTLSMRSPRCRRHWRVIERSGKPCGISGMEEDTFPKGSRRASLGSLEEKEEERMEESSECTLNS